MKAYRAYATFVATYFFSSLLALAFPVIQWGYNTNPYVAGVITVVWGTACSLGACIPATVGALLLTIAFGIKATNTGQSGRMLPPRAAEGHQVWHQTEDGLVHDFFNIAILQKGVDHVVWDNKGNVYTATKHPKTNDNVLTVHLGGRLAAEQGQRVIKRAEKLEARSDAMVDDISASWSYSGTAYDEYTQDDADKDGNQFYYDMFVGENHSQLAGPYDCTTLSAPNGDDERIKISLTPQGNGLTTEIEPACGP